MVCSHGQFIGAFSFHIHERSTMPCLSGAPIQWNLAWSDLFVELELHYDFSFNAFHERFRHSRCFINLLPVHLVWWNYREWPDLVGWLESWPLVVSLQRRTFLDLLFLPFRPFFHYCILSNEVNVLLKLQRHVYDSNGDASSSASLSLKIQLSVTLYLL